MRILLAPDSFGGTLSAADAADAMAAGWRTAAPHDTVRRLPLSDGGPGFLEVLHGALGGELVPLVVHGPLGEPVPATILLHRAGSTEEADAGAPSGEGEPGPLTAYVESAQAAGLHLLPPEQRDPARTSSYGVGELVRAAIERGAARVVVGIGGTATNDGGAGLLAALGLDAPLLRGGGGGLTGVTRDDVVGLPSLGRSLSHVDLVAAVDVDVPLLGLHGASAGFAQQKGATPEQAQDLERSLGRLAHEVATVLRADPVRTELLTPQIRRPLAQVAGAGAGGGLGFGLLALGARVLPGAAVVADAVALDEAVGEADVVVTGEGTLDWQSLHGKVVSAVAEAGLRHGVPVVAVAGQVYLGRREYAAAGLAATYAVAETPDKVAASLADPAGTLTARTERVARTWSR